RDGRGGADEPGRGAPCCVRHLRPLAAGAVSRLVPPVGAPARQLSTKQPSRSAPPVGCEGAMAPTRAIRSSRSSLGAVGSSSWGLDFPSYPKVTETPRHGGVSTVLALAERGQVDVPRGRYRTSRRHEQGGIPTESLSRSPDP